MSGKFNHDYPIKHGQIAAEIEIRSRKECPRSLIAGQPASGELPGLAGGAPALQDRMLPRYKSSAD
jgi:hypothetical protein